MKRTTLALALIIAILLISTVGGAYYVSVNHSTQGENSLPTASPTPTASPSSSFTPSPTSTSNSSSMQGSFTGPLGNFEITSPSNSTYSTNYVTLSVTGRVIVGSNVKLLMNYSLDGQESLPLPIVVQALDSPLVGSVVGSVTLPNLSDGSHSITVFGDIEANGRSDLAQATVYFTIQISG
jgi:hypothetical protein